MVAATWLAPNTSPISSIGTEASMPVLMVTTILMEVLHAPPEARVAPTGKAIRVVFESGAGAEELHVADKGAVERALVVYSARAGKVWPDWRAGRAGPGAMM